MRITAFLVFATLMQVSAATFGQKLTMKMDKASLKEIFNQINLQTGYDVVWTSDQLRGKPPVRAVFNDKEVVEVLNEILPAQKLTFVITDKTIVIKPVADPGFLERIKSLFASIDVHGRVVDEDLQGISGVTITLKNGKGAWTSGTDGSFFIKNLDENATLVFSYLGYEKLETELKGREDLGFIYMKVSTSKLDEVQIQAYGTTSKRISTSNITTIKAEDIAKQPVDNPLYALMGRVPGLIVTPTSGMYGASVKVQLRGQNSLQQVESEPTYVIDGVPVVNNISRQLASGVSALSLINPNDIESIDVLKDADATAIYGSRGANGVILITTKKGKVGETRITGNVNAGFSDVSKRIELMNTQQYLQMRKEAYKNDGLSLPVVPNINNFDLTLYDQNRYTDWQKEFLGGTAQNYLANVSIGGGSPTVQYLIGGTYNSMGYIFAGPGDYKSGTAHFNITGTSANQKLRASLLASYTGNKSTAPKDLTAQALYFAPNAPALYMDNGQLNWAPNTQSSRGETTWQNGNPYAGFSNAAKNNSNAINSTLDLSYNFWNSLVAKVTAGFSRVGYKSIFPTTIASQDPANYITNRGMLGLNDNVASTWSVEPQLTYSAFLGGGKISTIFGGSFQGQETKDQIIYAGGYTNDALLNSLNFSAPGSISGGNNDTQYKYAAVFGRINYNWKDKYILNVNARRDGSSRFGPGNQFGNFWSVGGAWVFTNEAFLKKTDKVLSFGKLRASYGTNGNDQIGDYRYIQTFNPINGSYQEVTPLQSNGPVNPDYHWENKKSIELGFDLGFFKDRILLSGSWFRSRVADQVLDQAIPATAGGASVLVNDMAKIQNTGAEMTLSAVNVQTPAFKWSTAANLSFLNRNKILALPEGQPLPARLVSLYDPSKESPVGKPFAGIVAAYEYRGVDPNNGTYMFSDFNGNTLSGTDAVSSDAYRYAKTINVAPKFTGGLSNQFSYKGWSLDIFLQFTKQLGRNYIYQIDGTPGVYNPATGNLPVALMDNWKKPGDQKDIQKFSQQFFMLQYIAQMANSDRAWVDASFIRVKNVALSYKFSSDLLQKLKLRNLSLNVSAQNLFTITGYKGIDPETQSRIALPPLRTITAGLSVGF